ncbi:MAG: YibE/F family protein [Clostridia bacterium]
MKNKNLMFVIIAIVVSCFYIFFANKYVTRNEVEDTILDDYSVYNARVVEIVEIIEDDYNLGYETIVGKTINFKAEVLNGDMKGETVDAKQEISPFFAIQPEEISLGDKILISQSYNSDGIDNSQFDMLEYVRTDVIVFLVLIFFAGLILFGKSKGILTIISLSLTCLSIFYVFIPSILNGNNIYFWAIQICIFIIVMTLMIANGTNLKSLSAGLGCVGGILTAGIITLILNSALRLSGMVDEKSVFLQMLNPDNPIDLKAIIFAAIIIGAVGAIMDVAISIASALSEIKLQNPDISFKKLYISGINIGKDILGTMTNTLILAYIGSALSTVLLLIANTGSMTYLVNTESIIIEVIQSIVGSFGILLTLPLTSLVSAFLYTRERKN